MTSSTDWRESVGLAVLSRLRADHPEDEEGRMLHAPGLRTPQGFYLFATPTHLVLKLPAARVQQLLATGEGEPCSPRPGHPMREWVEVPAPDVAHGVALGTESRAFVTGGGGRPTPG